MTRLHLIGGYDAAVGIMNDVWTLEVANPVADNLSWELVDVKNMKAAVSNFL